MKSAKLLVLILLSATILGYTNKPATASSKNIQRTSITAATPKLLTKEKQADAIVENIIDAINNKDAESLTPYIINQRYALDFAKAAIWDYKTLFKGKEIVGFQRIGKYNRNGFQYRIFSQNGLSKQIYVSFQGSQPKVYDEFLLYSARARGILTRLVTNIQKKDADKLARVLTPDVRNYPVSAARQIIANYEDKFDTETLRFRFVGLQGKDNYFIYNLYGFKNGKPVQHQVRIRHGDGLVSLDDYLLPKIN